MYVSVAEKDWQKISSRLVNVAKVHQNWPKEMLVQFQNVLLERSST